MIKYYKCIRISTYQLGFKVNQIYKTNENGCVIDSDGSIRLKPEVYNKNHDVDNTQFTLIKGYNTKLGKVLYEL